MDMSKILGASDEDFLKMPPPGGVSTGEEKPVEQEEQEQEQTTEEAAEEEETSAGNEGAELTDAERAAQSEGEEETESDEVEDPSAGDPAKTQKKPDDKAPPTGKESPSKKPAATEQTPEVKGKADPSKESKDKPKATVPGSDGDEQPATTPDYEGFYKRLIGGAIKANGKDLKLQNEDEVVNMIKMGANYTQKMQALAPQRKILMMLESNGLLDEGALGFLLDLHKKNPEAIKKLVKDSGIDPLDIDVKAESTYKPGNHSITNEEETFRSTLNDLKTNEHGMQTIQEINKWDDASKNMLYQHPGVMELVNEHRSNGIYKRIVETIEHRKTTGTIGAQVPFLQAYKAVGEELANAGKLNDLVRPQQTEQKSSVVVPPANQQQQTTGIVRKGQPKKQVVNTDKVNAAASTRSTPKTAKAVVNPLAMSDDDFLKSFQNRV